MLYLLFTTMLISLVNGIDILLPLGAQKYGHELMREGKTIGIFNPFDVYQKVGPVDWAKTSSTPSPLLGTERIYSRPLDIPMGDKLYEPMGTFRHTAYVTETSQGTLVTEKMHNGLQQNSGFNPSGWTLESSRPIVDTSTLMTTRTDKYNPITSNCQDYTNQIWNR